MSALKMFISYSHKDEFYREELEKHLVMMRRNGLIETWTDRKILPGQEWDKQIDKELENSDVILLLVSSDFLSSHYCYDIEVQKAMSQHENGSSTVVPLILRHCDWVDTPFGKIQGLPTDAKPVKDYTDIDSAFLNIVKGLRKIIDSNKIASNSINFKLINGDITNFTSDVIISKYAQNFYGIDKLVSQAVIENSNHRIYEIQPNSGEHKYVEVNENMKFKSVLFIGVEELSNFRYCEINYFSEYAIKTVLQELKNIQSVALSLQFDYGLDELEVFKSQLIGLKSAIIESDKSHTLENIFIIEKNKDIFERLKNYLLFICEDIGFTVRNASSWTYASKYELDENSKEIKQPYSCGKHTVFVLISTKTEFNDVFYYAIQRAAHENGFICEKIEYSNVHGNTLLKVFPNIEKAEIIIAELSDFNPEVCFEIGYAIGKNKKHIILVKKDSNLNFHLKDINPIVYDRVIDLKEKVSSELKKLK